MICESVRITQIPFSLRRFAPGFLVQHVRQGRCVPVSSPRLPRAVRRGAHGRTQRAHARLLHFALWDFLAFLSHTSLVPPSPPLRARRFPWWRWARWRRWSWWRLRRARRRARRRTRRRARRLRRRRLQARAGGEREGEDRAGGSRSPRPRPLSPIFPLLPLPHPQGPPEMVVEMGVFMHAAEGEMIAKSTNDKVRERGRGRRRGRTGSISQAAAAHALSPPPIPPSPSPLTGPVLQRGHLPAEQEPPRQGGRDLRPHH
jgi:hypothetical protein